MNHKIIMSDWKTHQRQLMDIRTQVFMQEQAVNESDEWDGLDDQATHFLVVTADENANDFAIGCARLLNEHNDQGAPRFHIGRVALLEAYRGCGIGSQLMTFIIQYCRTAASEREIYLHAQTERQGFYQRLGFIARGEEFMDAGIPHITMYFHQEGNQNG